MGINNIKRGEKWTEAKRVAAFENRNDDVKWMDSQESIVNDIKEYEESIIPETKSKVKK